MSAVTGQEKRASRDPVRIVEEVPGVPEHERYFVCGHGFERPYPHFSNSEDATTYLKARGIVDFVLEPFEP